MEKEILNYLDQVWNYEKRGYVFFTFGDGYFYPFSGKVHLYGDQFRWAMVFEKSGYHNRHLAPEITLYYFGNCLENLDRPLGTETNLKEIFLTSDAELDQISSDELGSFFEFVAPTKNLLHIRGKEVSIEKNSQEYEQKGISIEAHASGLNVIDFVSMFRLLESHFPLLFSATKEELRSSIPQDIPLIMTISDWLHSDDVSPSEQASYRMMAKVLEKQEANQWTFREKGNIHWKDWPDAGNL